MRRLLLAVGCDTYDHVESLDGAERDAKAVFQHLTAPVGDYDSGGSVLLLSPSVTAINAALSGLPFANRDIDTFTFFFAGHGGHKSGTYYLCAADSDPDRLSTTALAVGHLLSVITELRPRQANVIIDACQSGGAMLDSASLLRPDALGLGNPGSLSIAFLAACGPTEYAAETSNGGELTRRLIAYVGGEATLQTTRPAIDLIDLGRRVSADLSAASREQIPVGWGINLTGEGRFARNPRFAPATEELAEVASVLSQRSPNDQTGEMLQRHAFALWTLHRELEQEVDVARLRSALLALITDLKESDTAVALTLRGLATSMRAAAVKSSDVFAEACVLFACAEPLLARVDDIVAAQVAQQLLDEAANALAQARRWLLANLPADRFCLLADGNGLADLYFLPLRISRILGWLALGLELARLRGEPDSTAESEVREIAELLIRDYSTSMVPRSDAQAPSVLLFISTARSRGWVEASEIVAACYFCGFVEAHGIVSPPDLARADSFDFVVGLAAGPEHVQPRLRANPTQFLSALLLCGVALTLDDDWDVELSALDHQSAYIFVPASYLRFGDTLVEEGQNFGFQIGRDVFTLSDFRAFMREQVLPASQSASAGLSSLAVSLALVASCLQPDRLPLHTLDPETLR